MARFFIDRPVLSVVISLVIVFAGLASVATLPIAQYPEIAPPTVQVTCSYPGASAGVVAETVAAPIEQQINGVENMLYMSSQCTNDGGYSLTVTFKLGTNLDMAQVLVQNRVALATPTLPDTVKATGVSVKKRSPAILLVVNMFSEVDKATRKPAFNQLEISNYATIQIRDELARIDGVGDVNFLGQQDYSMRVWLDPEKMASRGLTTGDVINSLKEQNVQVAAGALARPPVPKGQDFQYTLSALGRLIEAEQFGTVIIRSDDQGRKITLKDIARIELGAKNQDTACTLDGKPSVGIAIFQLPGSNALDVADRIGAKMKELRKSFPKGMDYAIVYDTTPFIKESVHEVFKALRDAIILVAIVVLLFLQDWKAMILPMIDVPVSLIGTFVIMAAMGFTLNNLTLFGLVLAIGIVVDDAIVVLEAVEAKIAQGFPPKEATISAMGEITGPIIAITLVLSSVFLPAAFVPGISGQFYRQFALTISASMAISAINAMTMTPSRAVMIFKEQGAHGDHGHQREALPWWAVAALLGWATVSLAGLILPGPLGYGEVDPHAVEQEAPVGLVAKFLAIDWLMWGLRAVAFIPGAIVGCLITPYVNKVLAKFFGAFNRVFDFVTGLYGKSVAWCLRLSFIVVVLYGGLLVLTGVGFTKVPTGFIPVQDKGYLLMDVTMADSASLERSSKTLEQIDAIVRSTEGVDHSLGIAGQSIVQNAVNSNFASVFVILKPFHDRHGPDMHSDAIAQVLRAKLRQVVSARIGVYGAPAVDGLGNASGFKLMVEDRGSAGLGVLQGQADNLADHSRRIPGMAGVVNSFRASTPQMFVNVNRDKCKTLEIPLDSVFNTLQVYLGGYYVNDFNRFGRTWQVNIQADAKFRITPENVGRLQVRNASGGMVPLAGVSNLRDSAGPALINRYNMFTAATVNGATLPSLSSGEAIKQVGAVADRQLASGMRYEWTELAFLQLQEGNAVIFAFVGAVVLVFLILAAQYESWSMPAAIILIVPMCLLCSIVGVAYAHLDINIFVQVGFLVLVGLAAKNAILIVEFARVKQSEGSSTFDAAVEASKSRLRPIVMTSFAFILGVVPLMFAGGAGAEMRRTLGIAVFSGMLGVTFFGIFLTPVFYFVVDRLGGGSTPPPPAPQPAAGAPHSPAPAHAPASVPVHHE